MVPLRAMHAADLAPMREKPSDRMSAWLGGPRRHLRRPDAVCLGATHGAFPIDTALRDQWLGCGYRSLDAIGAPAALQRRVRPPLAGLATFPRNC